MNYNILHYYGRSLEGESSLLGAHVHDVDGDFSKSIYVGIPFVLEDINNDINRKVLGVIDVKEFANKYNAVNASGIVYFPQTNKYKFLHEGDEVILWNGNERIEESLNAALECYKNTSSNDIFSEFMAYEARNRKK